MNTHGHSQTDDTGRAARVARVIESVTASRLRGAGVSDEQIIAEYPDLLPELGEELRELAGVLEARQRAEVTADARGAGDADCAESDLDETAAASPAKTISDSLPGGYTIVREIHRGGQGVVYQALQRSTNGKVAIKVMKEGPFAGPADKARFEREVQILGQLKHPQHRHHPRQRQRRRGALLRDGLHLRPAVGHVHGRGRGRGGGAWASDPQ